MTLISAFFWYYINTVAFMLVSDTLALLSIGLYVQANISFEQDPLWYPEKSGLIQKWLKSDFIKIHFLITKQVTPNTNIEILVTCKIPEKRDLYKILRPPHSSQLHQVPPKNPFPSKPPTLESWQSQSTTPKTSAPSYKTPSLH